MIIKNSEFVKSAVKRSQFPEPLPQIVFVGKSNVGKSSLMNCLLNRKKIARVSKRPGCTQLINFFLVNGKYHFVDIPGYGYSKVSDSKKRLFERMTEDFFHKNPQLRAIIMLTDMKTGPTEQDIEAYQWLHTYDYNIIPVFTKSDRVAVNRKKNTADKISAALGCELYGDVPVRFSSKTGEGKEALLARIQEYLEE